MKRRYVALALTAALVVPGAAVTAASASARSGTSAVQSDRSDAPGQNRGTKNDSKPGKPAKKGKTVVYDGTISAVDAEAKTFTVKVRGGRDKKLRTTGLTLAFPDGVRVIRNGRSAEPADLQVGDRVNVQTRQTAKVVTVVRVTAKGKKVAPTPSPSETVAPEPSATTTPEPGDDADDDSADPDHDSIPAPSPTA
ncbi:hypothetical protein [Kineosporia succinea]|uniref:Ribosomal 50S subunit-recycling heat shock protein n=1 Tax=Kineosporia succinea TaxID=84632 RepID=A0ABT9P8B0_9ACTN|nr:hypothetical protein [Kineosporia succinea]MDP9828390.1 ribosomal 50S subunit-recycling heat shock protein [Kineosporia succinea]